MPWIEMAKPKHECKHPRSEQDLQGIPKGSIWQCPDKKCRRKWELSSEYPKAEFLPIFSLREKIWDNITQYFFPY